MVFFLCLFLLVLLPLFFSKRKRKRKKRKAGCFLYNLNCNERFECRKLKELIVGCLDNLPTFSSYNCFAALKHFGLKEQPLYKVDVCSYKQFRLVNCVKRRIKTKFNLVCMFVRRLPLYKNEDVYCFIKRKLPLKIFSLINAFDISNSVNKRGKHAKLFSICGCEKESYYSNKFLISEYENKKTYFTRNLKSCFFKVESKNKERVFVSFFSLFNEGVGFVKKVAGGVSIKSIYSGKEYFLSYSGKRLTKLGVCDHIEVSGKQLKLTLSDKLCACDSETEILNSLKNNLTIKSDNALFDRVFNFTLYNKVVKSLILEGNEKEFKNYLSCDIEKEFDLNKLNDIVKQEEISCYYAYLRNKVVGFNEQSGRVVIAPKSDYLTCYTIKFNNMVIEVDNRQREQSCVVIDNVNYKNFNLLPMSKKEIKIFY